MCRTRFAAGGATATETRTSKRRLIKAGGVNGRGASDSLAVAMLRSSPKLAAGLGSAATSLVPGAGLICAKLCTFGLARSDPSTPGMGGSVPNTALVAVVQGVFFAPRGTTGCSAPLTRSRLRRASTGVNFSLARAAGRVGVRKALPAPAPKDASPGPASAARRPAPPCAARPPASPCTCAGVLAPVGLGPSRLALGARVTCSGGSITIFAQ